MITLAAEPSIPTPSLQPNFPTEDDSKIPFLFAAVPHKLFLAFRVCRYIYGVLRQKDPVTIGVCGFRDAENRRNV